MPLHFQDSIRNDGILTTEQLDDICRRLLEANFTSGKITTVGRAWHIHPMDFGGREVKREQIVGTFNMTDEMMNYSIERGGLEQRIIQAMIYDIEGAFVDAIKDLNWVCEAWLRSGRVESDRDVYRRMIVFAMTLDFVFVKVKDFTGRELEEIQEKVEEEKRRKSCFRVIRVSENEKMPVS